MRIQDFVVSTKTLNIGSLKTNQQSVNK